MEQRYFSRICDILILIFNGWVTSDEAVIYNC